MKEDGKTRGCAVSLTGDPITIGHRDVIKRAYAMFGRVVVFLAGGSSKKGSLLGYEDRKALVKAALAEDGLTDFEVLPISGALVDCAKKAGADVIVRGLRNEQDLVYETDMSAVNRMLAPGIETVYLPCRPELSYVSSSAVRELARLGKFAEAARFSSTQAAMAMKLRLTKTVALTGGIACGKSTAQKVFERRGWLGIDCDELNRELLDNAQYRRKVIVACAGLGHDVSGADGILDRKKLADAVFGDFAVRAAVESLAFPEIAEKLRYRLSLYGAGQPLRAVVQAPLLFDGLSAPFRFKFDRTVCVSSYSYEQEKRLVQLRGHSEEEAAARINSQSPLIEKEAKCDYVLRNDGTVEEFEKAVDRLAADLEEELG